MHTRSSTIKVGDLVLLLQRQTSKATTVYEQSPFKVSMISGNQATIIRGNQKLIRNVSMLKLFTPQQTKDAEQDNETVAPKQKAKSVTFLPLERRITNTSIQNSDVEDMISFQDLEERQFSTPCDAYYSDTEITSLLPNTEDESISETSSQFYSDSPNENPAEPRRSTRMTKPIVRYKG